MILLKPRYGIHSRNRMTESDTRGIYMKLRVIVLGLIVLALRT